MSRSGTAVRIVASLAAVLALSSACTDDDPAPGAADPDAVNSTVAETKAGKAPSPAQRCTRSGNTTARKAVLTTSDKVNLSGITFGTGARGVLLLPAAGTDACPWWDYATELVGRGFQVLAVDFRGTGYSDAGNAADYTADAVAGVAALKAGGAQRVVIIGAALGAATALVTAARVPDQVAGVVSLSYPDDSLDVSAGTGDGPRSPTEAAQLITAPLLVCFATGDRRSAAAKPADLVARAGSSAKQLVGRPGVSHGWDMLKIGDDDVRPEILGFLESYA